MWGISTILLGQLGNFPYFPLICNSPMTSCISSPKNTCPTCFLSYSVKSDIQQSFSHQLRRQTTTLNTESESNQEPMLCEALSNNSPTEHPTAISQPFICYRTFILLMKQNCPLVTCHTVLP